MEQQNCMEDPASVPQASSASSWLQNAPHSNGMSIADDRGTATMLWEQLEEAVEAKLFCAPEREPSVLHAQAERDKAWINAKLVEVTRSRTEAEAASAANRASIVAARAVIEVHRVALHNAHCKINEVTGKRLRLQSENAAERCTFQHVQMAFALEFELEWLPAFEADHQTQLDNELGDLKRQVELVDMVVRLEQNVAELYWEAANVRKQLHMARASLERRQSTFGHSSGNHTPNTAELDSRIKQRRREGELLASEVRRANCVAAFSFFFFF
uniref:Uncharacterized protein n=1 Tax=Erythrolobus australicus TaxID=1077150 RepID=A0A7S1TLG1_9RHOD|mmetsp:Transcript_1176/g.3329  ORF Transcript_1176/g.3329 Transcript_1176/m.3329 type:complete len:272 (+) Transcript_1176:368-1183(+)